MPPHDQDAAPVAPAASGGSEWPPLLDVEVEGKYDRYSGRYVQTEELSYGAPVWQQRGSERCIEYAHLCGDPAEARRWAFGEPNAEGTHVLFIRAAEGCRASASPPPPQSVGAWVANHADPRVRTPVPVRISVPGQGIAAVRRAAAAPLESGPGRGTEAAQLTARLDEARAVIERQRAAAREAAEQLKAERVKVDELKKKLTGKRAAKEAAEAALAASRREAARLRTERDAARAAVDHEAKKLGSERAAKEAAEAALAVSQREAARLKTERDAAQAAADHEAKKLGSERGAKEAAEAALAVSQREAARLKTERDAAQAAADHAAEELGGERAAKKAAEARLGSERAAKEAAQGALADARVVSEQVPGMMKLMNDFRERILAAEVPAPPPDSAVRRYYKRYADSSAAATPAQLDASNLFFLLQCAEIPGAGPESEFAAMHATLKEKVDKRVAADKAKGKDFGRMTETEARMALMWSAGSAGCATYHGRPLEFGGWINLALVHKGSDRPLQRALPGVRTLNGFCVTAPREGDGDAAPAGERWAGEEMEDTWITIGRNDSKLYRGAGMPVEHKDWFIPGRVYRQPRYVATSLKQDTAQRFARREGGRPGRSPVIWEVLIHKERKCCHVNHLGTRFSFFDEAELLFPPGSVFTVKSVDWAEPGSGCMSRITIEAAPDNKEHPLDLPEAPWS